MIGLRRLQFASEAARELLSANGIDRLERLFSRRCNALHARSDRCVWPVDLARPNGLPLRAFVKMNWGWRRLIPRSTDLRTGQALWSLPAREWEGIEQLRQIGLNVPERLALFEEGLVRFRSAVVVQSVPGEASLSDWVLNGHWADLPRNVHRDVLEAVAGCMRTIHGAGLAWRGASCRHFLPEHVSGGGWKLWLIDCEGVHRATSPRDAARDLRKLWRSCHEIGADQETLDRLAAEIDDAPARRAA